MAFSLIRVSFNKMMLSWLTRNSYILAATALGISIFLHTVIWSAALNTRPFKKFFHFDAINFPVRSQAEDIYLYCDYPLPVTTVDLLDNLPNCSAPALIPQKTHFFALNTYRI